MRVKIVKTHKKYSKGEIIEVSPNEGFGLIDSGYAILTKDMTERDYGIASKLRPNKRR